MSGPIERRLKKWPRLWVSPLRCGGKPCLFGTRLTTEHVFINCAGSDSEEHIKDFQRNWPHAEAESIRQAIAFERSRRKGKRLKG